MENQIEKIKLSNKGEEIEIYDSYAAYRLENETFPEYKIRQKVINDLSKQIKKVRNLDHISAMLIPQMTPEGKMARINGEVKWIGVTKGITYIKSKDGQTES